MEEDMVRMDTRIIYLEDAIQQMNVIIMEQGEMIHKFKKALGELEEKVRELEEKDGGPGLLEESGRPPHY